MSTAEIIQVLEGHSSDVMGCDFFDDCLATCSSDKSVRLWFLESEEAENDQKRKFHFHEAKFSPLIGHTYGVNCVRFSPFGTLLASCSTDGRVIFWNVQDGQKLDEIQHLEGPPVRVCSFSSTSAMFATGGDDEKVVLWDITTKSVIRILEAHEAMISAITFTPDGAFLLSCSTAGDIMLWDARYGHGKYLCSITNAHDLGILGCDSSPQYEAVSENGFLTGNYTIATCGNDDFVNIWSVEASATKRISLIIKLEGHTGNVNACRFSYDGSILASTGGDRVVFLWNPKTGEALQKLEGHNRYVTCCAFSNGSLLATGSNDKTVVLWTLNRENIFNSLDNPSSIKEKGILCSPPKRSFLLWTVEDVINWLKSLKLEEYIEIFSGNSIDGKELMYLNHENLSSILKIDSLGQRNKILRAIQYLKNPLWQHAVSDIEDEMVLNEFCCPITHEVMRDPVVAADGYSYEKQAIEEWLENGKETSPMTNEILAHKILTPNHILLQLIQKYKT
ncbi:WD repeat, SAM and U-box domain-containing protein 1-like [Argiope bruennichi]|uniref:WD repeat, SAM and U-box domain-containing protein 1 n=1 Tax=Argiope bruennichi TaxID=94029 RepID=A0A8T0FL22_ARGBR|nr:WD repeat, SAM and U-box domain-containing protein 1-like [Argiope bruennichi]XP_055930622.1 WD repeat, SAM and U-box domain-containing protein 1-like [Argiope bruennichi]KAF8791075.1 WD repeat like protein [Argiope bruennichi]